MADVAVRNRLLTTRRLHSCAERDTDELAEFFISYELIPALVVHPLAKQFDGRLCIVLLLLRHVEVIDEDDRALAEFGAPYTLTTSIHISIDDVLGLVGRGLGREGQAQESPLVVLEAFIKLAHD